MRLILIVFALAAVFILIRIILLKRSEELSFLFSEQNWNLRGPVDYRVSHGDIYFHGEFTPWTDDDLFDTGMTARLPSLSSLVNGRKTG